MNMKTIDENKDVKVATADPGAPMLGQGLELAGAFCLFTAATTAALLFTVAISMWTGLNLFIVVGGAAVLGVGLHTGGGYLIAKREGREKTFSFFRAALGGNQVPQAA
jgi:hypothetical protein